MCGNAVILDAGGGGVRCDGEADAGLSSSGDVQTVHGRTRPLHVPIEKSRRGKTQNPLHRWHWRLIDGTGGWEGGERILTRFESC